MKPKTIVLMIVAVVCGLAASYMTSRVIAERNNNNDAADDDKVIVLVAKQKITYGTHIKDPAEVLRRKVLHQGGGAQEALKSWDQLKDKRLNKPLNEDQFVTAEDLMDPKTIGPEGLLPPGMRAVSLRVNVSSGAAGFILPNSRVDLVQTIRNADQPFALTILQNMLVLASDSMYIRADEKASNVASTVTLAAKPEDAQKIRLAEMIGELSLTLRGSEDNNILAIKTTKPHDLTKSSSTDNGSTEGDGAGAGGIGSKVPDVAGSAPAAVPQVKVEPLPPKTVTQIIYNGETVTKTVYRPQGRGSQHVGRED